MKLTTKRIKLIVNLSFYEFKKEFLGTSLGYLWNLIKPTLIILIYWFVFNQVMRIPPPLGIPYVPYLTSALIPWFFISNSLVSGSACMINNINLIKKVKFNLFNIPIISLFANIYNFLIMLFIVFVVSSFFNIYPNIYWLQLIYYFIATILLINGFNYIFATLSTLQSDIHQLLLVCLQLLMYVSPVLWSLQSPSFKVTGIHLFLVKIIPFFYIISGFRDTILYPHFNIINVGTNSIYYVIYFWVFVLLVNLFGFLLFKKYKGEFADLL